MTSTLTREVLLQYPNKVFVETGTNDGSGLIVALGCEFEKYYTVELDPKLVENAHKLVSELSRYGTQPMISIFEGKSDEVLSNNIIPDLTDQATFWLDAHSDGSCPILRELDAIALHPIKTHTILIDDIRMFGRPEHENITVKQLVDKLLSINKNYSITFAPSPHGLDILVATPNVT